MPARPVYHEHLGEFFARLRARKGWTQRQTGDLAHRRGLSGVTYQVLQRLEAGKTKNPNPALLRSLALLYEVPYEELLATLWETTYGVPASRVVAVQDAAALRPTAIEGFVALPLLARPIAAGQPLVVERDPDRDDSIAFAERFVARFHRPICLRVGRREESMQPTILPGDVVAIDQREDVRTRPKAAHIYAVNFAPLTGDDGGAVKRIEVVKAHLIVSSDNTDKVRYPTGVYDVSGRNLLDILKGEVVWSGRYLGTGKGR